MALGRVSVRALPAAKARIAVGPWQSGLMRRLYTSVDVQASRASESFRTRQYVSMRFMKKKIVADKQKFDAVLAQLLKMKPIAAKDIKTRGRKGSKAPIIPPRP